MLSRLGTRALIAQALSENAEQVRTAVDLLLADAADEARPHRSTGEVRYAALTPKTTSGSPAFSEPPGDFGRPRWA